MIDSDPKNDIIRVLIDSNDSLRVELERMKAECVSLRVILTDKERENRQNEAFVRRLRLAIGGGTALQGPSSLLEFMASRIMHIYGENFKTDFIIAAFNHADMLRSALKETDPNRKPEARKMTAEEFWKDPTIAGREEN